MGNESYIEQFSLRKSTACSALLMFLFFFFSLITFPVDLSYFPTIDLRFCSVREVCGKEDIDIAYKHFKAFYQTFSSIDRKLIVDY